jgi:hypothetical protein
MMNEYNFNKFFRGFHFIGCAVRSRSFIYLLGRELYDQEEGQDDPEEADIRKCVVNISLDNPEDNRYGASIMKNFEISHIAVSQYPKPHSVVVDLSGSVCVRGSGVTGMESEIAFDDDKGPQRGGVSKLRSIDGYVYGVGYRHSICRREGFNKWVPIWNGLPLPKVKHKIDELDFGFEDIDGFSVNDIYAVGGKGDVWHFDGKAWAQIPFPSNVNLYNVCCGGDGQVYIAGRGGRLFRGRGARWQQIGDACTSGWFNDMAWFQDRIWATNDYGIKVWTGKEMTSPEVPDFVRSSTGYLSAADGVLAIAGMYGASMHNGKEWVSLADLVDLYRRYGD